MPPRVSFALQSKRKEKEETQYGEPGAKRPKQSAPATKARSGAPTPRAKPIPTAKCVINLHDAAVMKVPAETYINPTVRRLFGDVVVRRLPLSFKTHRRRRWMISVWSHGHSGLYTPRTRVLSRHKCSIAC
jgi:hypothetical protein